MSTASTRRLLSALGGRSRAPCAVRLRPLGRAAPAGENNGVMAALATAALESVGVGAIGVALGTAVVAVCLLGVRRGIAGTLGQPVLEVPWATAVALALGAVTAGAATAALAAWSATRTPAVHLVAAPE